MSRSLTVLFRRDPARDRLIAPGARSLRSLRRAGLLNDKGAQPGKQDRRADRP